MILQAEEETEEEEMLPQPKGTRWAMDGGLHTGYELDFVSHRADEVQPIFTAPVLPGLIAEMDKLRLSEPAKPPNLRGSLSSEELWVALRHSSYAEGKNLSDKLVGMTNEFLNPPPLAHLAVPPTVPLAVPPRVPELLQ